jgi:hypothetical protein
VEPDAAVPTRSGFGGGVRAHAIVRPDVAELVRPSYAGQDETVSMTVENEQSCRGGFQSTLQRGLAAQPRATTIAELQARLDWFATIYNH